ncbi:MAG: hypothetical protein HYZ79_07580 [Candidatus Melainabacteria bacterium]|nr:hypothetical protein [Candidatus Melainabacteria bacterium]
MLLFNKKIINIFILLNLFTTLIVNIRGQVNFSVELRPDKAVENSILRKGTNKSIKYIFTLRDNILVKFLNLYSHLTGLQGKYQMFVLLLREKAMLIPKGQYDDSTIVDLPIPLNSNRKVTDKFLFDFKEVKYNHNLLFNAPTWREEYANYLCKTFNNDKSKKLKSIILESHKQKIYNPRIASQLSRSIEETKIKEIVSIFDCSKTSEF